MWCPGQFQCSNSHCISRSLVCNGYNDCFDRSDERDCHSDVCRLVVDALSVANNLEALVFECV